MTASKPDIIRYYASRLFNKITPAVINRGVIAENPTIILTAGFNGNLGDQALLQVSRQACARAGQQPLALSYENARNAKASSIVVMAGGEIGDQDHLTKFIELQKAPALTRIIGIAFSNLFLSSPCPKVVKHLTQMKTIYVRDKHNAQLANSKLNLTNITYAPDITFSLYDETGSDKSKAISKQPSPRNKHVAINIQAFFCNLLRNGQFTADMQLSDSLAMSSPGFVIDNATMGYIKAIGRLIRIHWEQKHSIVIPVFGQADRAFAKAILREINIRVPIVSAAWNYPEMIKILAKCDLLYASRYHAHVAGIIAQVPTVSIVVGKKTKAY